MHEPEPAFRWASFTIGVLVGFTVGVAFCAVVMWVTLNYLADTTPEKVPVVELTPADGR